MRKGGRKWNGWERGQEGGRYVRGKLRGREEKGEGCKEKGVRGMVGGRERKRK